MKNITTIMAATIFTVFTATANAECDINLTIEQLNDCIVAEGAGQSYEDYLNEVANIDTTQVRQVTVDSQVKKSAPQTEPNS